MTRRSFFGVIGAGIAAIATGQLFKRPEPLDASMFLSADDADKLNRAWASNIPPTNGSLSLSMIDDAVRREKGLPRNV